MKRIFCLLAAVLLLCAGCAKKELRIVSASTQAPGADPVRCDWRRDSAGRLVSTGDGAAFDYAPDYDAPAAAGDGPAFKDPEPPAFGGALTGVPACRVTATDGTTALYLHGLLTEQTSPDGGRTVYLRAANGLVTAERHYDAAGALTETWDYRYIGDDYGTIMECDLLCDGEEIGYFGYDYDLGGHLSKKIRYAADETPLWTVAYTWEDARLVRCTRYNGRSDLVDQVTYTWE